MTTGLVEQGKGSKPTANFKGKARVTKGPSRGLMVFLYLGLVSFPEFPPSQSWPGYGPGVYGLLSGSSGECVFFCRAAFRLPSPPPSKGMVCQTARWRGRGVGGEGASG